MQHFVSMLGAALVTIATFGMAWGQTPDRPSVPHDQSAPSTVPPQPEGGRDLAAQAGAKERVPPGGLAPAALRPPRSFADALRCSGRGSLSATEWCLERFDAERDVQKLSRNDRPVPYSPEELSIKLRLYDRWIDLWSGQLGESTFDILERLRKESGPGIPALGREQSLRLVDRLLETAGVQRTTAEVWLAKARMLASGGDGADVAQARVLYAQIQSRFAGTCSAERAARLAARADWRDEHLSIGREAPDFITRDAAGNEIRLAEFRGQVLVVHFWHRDSDRESDDRSLDQLRELVQSYWDTPFALIGINGDADRDQHRTRWVEHGVVWHEAFEPTNSEGGRAAWQIDEWPSTYLLDANGIVRGTFRPGLKLGKLVDPLVNRHVYGLQAVKGSESNRAR